MSSNSGGNFPENPQRGLSSDELETIAACRKTRRREIERQAELGEEILAERHDEHQSNDSDDIRNTVKEHTAALKRGREGKFIPEDVLVHHSAAVPPAPSTQANLNTHELPSDQQEVAPPPKISSFKDKGAYERYEALYYNASPETQKQLQEEAKEFREAHGQGARDHGLRISLMSTLLMDPKNVGYFPIHPTKRPSSAAQLSLAPKPPKM